MKVKFTTSYRGYNVGTVVELDERESTYVIGKGFAEVFTGAQTVSSDSPTVSPEMLAKLSRNLVGGEHGEQVPTAKRFGTTSAGMVDDDTGIDFSKILQTPSSEPKPVKTGTKPKK